MSIFREFGIDGKVFCLLTDGAKAMVKLGRDINQVNVDDDDEDEDLDEEAVAKLYQEYEMMDEEAEAADQVALTEAALAGAKETATRLQIRRLPCTSHKVVFKFIDR